MAMPPSAAYQLIRGGHQVVVERNAGAGAGFPGQGIRTCRAQSGGRARAGFPARLN